MQVYFKTDEYKHANISTNATSISRGEINILFALLEKLNDYTNARAREVS